MTTWTPITGTIEKTTARNDRRKSPAPVYYRLLSNLETIDAARNHAHVTALDQAGKTANVHFTSLKTWKTRPEAEIGCKYGLYEHWKETIYPDKPQTIFVEILDIDRILDSVIVYGNLLTRMRTAPVYMTEHSAGDLKAIVYRSENDARDVLFQRNQRGNIEIVYERTYKSPADAPSQETIADRATR